MKLIKNNEYIDNQFIEEWYSMLLTNRIVDKNDDDQNSMTNITDNDKPIMCNK